MPSVTLSATSCMLVATHAGLMTAGVLPLPLEAAAALPIVTSIATAKPKATNFFSRTFAPDAAEPLGRIIMAAPDTSMNSANSAKR